MNDATPTTLEARIQRLEDLEAIRDLKARYFRLVDAQDWSAFRELFTADATFDLGDGNLIEGADTFVASVAAMMGGVSAGSDGAAGVNEAHRGSGRARSVHRGHMPELVIDGPTEAHGLWGLADYIEWPSDPETGARGGYRGYGYEIETYRKADGEWLIATWVLQYLRVDPLPREPLPADVQGAPSVMRDDDYMDQVVKP